VVQRFGARLDLGELIDARVVHQHIQPAETLDGRLDQRLDLGLDADIGLHCHRIPTCGLDVGDDLLGRALVGGVVDDDLRPVTGEAAGDPCTNAF